jgi:UDP-2-acetamido-3-amino-2,3-dideoxy-glucuronate N-acetyltransferase
MTVPNVACIGAGHWGRNLVRNFAELGALGVVCEADPAVRETMAQLYPDARTADHVADVLADPVIDAVAIATPAETHGALVRAALHAGKDVLVEKPLCLDTAEGEELVDLAAREGRVLMVGHLLWYHPAVLKLRELIESGELGRLQYIYSNRLNLGKIRREENILWSFAPHDISVMLGLVGETPSSVDVRGGNYLHDEIADVTVSLFAFPSGVKGHVFVSWLHPFKEQKLVVVGDRKMAVFNDMETTDKLVLYPHTIKWRNGFPVPDKAEAQPVPLDTGEPLRAECAHFLESVATRARPRTDGREALRVLRVLEACEASLRERGGLSSAAPAPPSGNGSGAHGDNGGNGVGRGAASSAASSAAHGAGKPAYFVHESSYIDDGCTIGKGTSIWHFSHVLPGTVIGRNCKIGQNVVMGPRVTIGDGVKIQNNVSVYEGVTLEDDVFCGPSMVFTNVFNPRSEIVRKDEYRKTLVKRGASIGANATIVCGATIGRYAFIGAGAVVIQDVPDHALVVGNPARQVGWVCMCGNRAEYTGADTPACSSCYQTRRTARSPT